MEVNSPSPESPSPSLLSADDPQCNLVVDGIDNLNLGGEVESVANLQSISDDVLLNILLYCGPTDVEEKLKFVNRRFHNATTLSTLLWKEFCILSGKTVDAQFTKEHSEALSSTDSDFVTTTVSPRSVSSSLEEIASVEDATSLSSLCPSSSTTSTTSADSNLYRQYYFRNPCVPVDFSSINEALKHCPRTKKNPLLAENDKSVVYSDVGTVVLMPGVYVDERIDIGGEPWSVGQPTFDRCVAIRAAFPLLGATICSPPHPKEDEDDEDDDAVPLLKDRPCISISTVDEDALEGVQKGISVRLSHLRILHSAPGANIWGGNTAISIDGPRAQVIIDSCVLQSDSGRGLVVSTQAVCEMYRTSIVNCAATGFYLGDYGSRARISKCNIVRNGFGSKLLLSNEDEASNNQVTPSGHSGVYIESSMCWIDDSLMSGNCLTGLSVVRGGFVSLSGSDITENGHMAPILIEDAHDVRDGPNLQLGVSIRGGVVEGPVKNNYTSLKSADTSGENDDKNELHILKGGAIRDVGNMPSWARQHLLSN